MKKAAGTGALIGTNVAVVVMVSAEEDAAAENRLWAPNPNSGDKGGGSCWCSGCRRRHEDRLFLSIQRHNEDVDVDGVDLSWHVFKTPAV
jgi:hypothetical protein